MQKGVHRDAARYEFVPRELYQEERVCLTCPYPDCKWTQSLHGFLCPIQRKAREDAKV